jgi:hypothetical protein
MPIQWNYFYCRACFRANIILNGVFENFIASDSVSADVKETTSAFANGFEIFLTLLCAGRKTLHVSDHYCLFTTNLGILAAMEVIGNYAG